MFFKKSQVGILKQVNFSFQLHDMSAGYLSGSIPAKKS
jgi:hypothetical protein